MGAVLAAWGLLETTKEIFRLLGPIWGCVLVSLVLGGAIDRKIPKKTIDAMMGRERKAGGK